ARARLGPAVSLETGFLASNDPVDSFALSLKQERFSATDFFLSDPNHPGTARDWNAAVAATWTFDVSGALRGEARAAAAMADASERLASRSRDGAVFDALVAFSKARRSEERLALLAERQADAEKDVALADSMREQGLTTAADPARARSALAEIRGEIASEKAAQAAARADLAASIGSDDAARPLAPLPAGAPVAEKASYSRDDAAASRLASESARAAEKAASAGRWPSLMVEARYQTHAPRPSARWGDSSSALAAVRLPLFASGAVDARIAEARAARQVAESSERETLALAETEAVSARASLAAAESRLAAFSEAESAARTAREIQDARYREGAASLGDLLEARAAELRARLGVANARADRAVAEAQLRLAVGLPPEGEGSR
ncbi:MAG TPA: TolC family protein, partial [Anaeromyxobacter sp.]